MSDYLHPGGTDGGYTLKNDPIVEEVRKARQAYAEQFNYDIERIVADLNRKAQLHKERLVAFAPKITKKSRLK